MVLEFDQRFFPLFGVSYEIKSSSNLRTWETIESVYGLGQEVSVGMVTLTPPPPGVPPVSTDLPHVVSLVIQPAAGAEGGFVASWISSESESHGDHSHESSTYHFHWFPEALPAILGGIPLSSHRFDDFEFTILHLPLERARPATNPVLVGENASLLTSFQTHFPEMTANLLAGTISHGQPSILPGSSGAREFFKVVAHWDLDSDGDGSFDWLEFHDAAVLAPPGGGGGTGGGATVPDPFEGDTNGDGVPDGAQTDSDKDGIPNQDDHGPTDPVIDWLLLPEPRYALFDLEIESPSADIPPQAPLQINSRGESPLSRSSLASGCFKATTDRDRNQSY